MEDNYLDKVFHDKLESPQHFDFDEAAWDNLAARLEDEPTRRIIPWRWLAAAGIMLPLLLSSGYLFLKLKQTERTVAELKSQVNHLAGNFSVEKAINANATLSKMTEEKTEIATINSFPPILQNDSKAIAQQAMAMMNQKNSTKEQNTIVTPKQKKKYKESKEIEHFENTIVYGENSSYLNKLIYTEAKERKQNVVNNALENLITKEKTLDIKENNWVKAKASLIPVGFELGTTYQTGLTFKESLVLKQRPFFNVKGLKGAINFADNVDLTFGANYLTSSFETQVIEQDFPHVVPNSASDVFQKVVVSENVLQVPIGLKYNFGNYDALFSPFVEIGAIAKRVVQKNHKYEYQASTSRENTYAILPKPVPVSASLEMNTLTGSVGIAWNPNTKILNNLVLQAELFTTADIENIETPVTMIGVGVSAKYMF